MRIDIENKAFFGYLVVGFASLLGGIFIFAFIVLPGRQPDTGVPRDVQMVFTQVFSQQGLAKNEKGRYTPALIEVGVDQETCRRYSCLMTLTPTGDGFEFVMMKDGRRWGIDHHSPVPKEKP